MTIGLDISVLNDRQKTGIAVYTYQLIDALLRINKKDKFILFGIATFETFNYLKNLPFKNYPNVEMKIFKLPARAFRLAFLSWQKIGFPKIEHLVTDVDIFHSFNWFLPPQKAGLTVATIFDLTPILFPKWHQEKTVQLEKVRLQTVSSQADLVVTISENSKKDFLKLYPKKRVEVIYPGVAQKFKLKFKKEKLNWVLDKYGLNSGYLLFVGTLEPRKNIKNLITAYLKSDISEKLVLVGNWGWESSEMAGMIKNNREQIIHTGYVAEEDLPYLYKGALCLVYPSFYEGFGLPIIEAQACGCPVITSNVSSMPEVAGKGAILVDPYSTEDIIRGIREVRGMREELIKRGFENIKRFSWESSAKKLMWLYQKLYLK